jgi:type VI secretion system secreted protein VgrG
LKQSDQATDQSGQAQRRDVFRWPAVSFANDEVTDRARRMVEASTAAVSQSSSSSTFRGLIAGGRFTLAEDPQASGADGGAYIVTTLAVDVIDETWWTGGASSDYANSFSCLPDNLPWRQPIETPRPKMAGVHAAIVLGPEGEEIYTDDLGRVKVRFFWDWRNDADAAQSVWARVVQPWAGRQWGGQFIPRVGTEVAVAFVDNDPDRPIVLGGLYNAEQRPIYTPAEKTKSGFRSRSSLGGGPDQFNEFTFDDQTGQERVYLKAQRDLQTQVLHDASHNVVHDRTRQVGHDEAVTIGGRQTITITGDRNVGITRGNDSLRLDQGDISVEAAAGHISIEAQQSIELRVGNSTIRIDPNGITISALNVSISGQLAASLSAPMVSIDGKGETSIHGGIVLINS